MRHFQMTLLLALIGMGAHAAENAKCCVPIAVTVTPKIAPDRPPALNIKITNTGAAPLSFSIGSGPWIGPDQIRLVAMLLPSGRVIPNEMQSIRDPRSGEITLPPGGSEERQVPLESVYPELTAELRKQREDIVLFWTYQLYDSDSGQSERVGGWLRLSSPGR
jgi:hypothetical protein